MSDSALLRRPSAFVPLIMSTAALGTVLGYLALHGPAPQQDEGAAAHAWQLLMAGQVPFILYFAGRWAPGAGRRGLAIVAVQLGAALAAAAPVFLLGW